MAEQARRGNGVARAFTGQPERLAAAWRRMRFAEARKDGHPPRNQLDSIVEPFIREVGRSLEGQPGSAWGRTSAVLKLAPSRGERVLLAEFEALRRCLMDAVETLGGGDEEQAVVTRALDEAVESSLALMEQLTQPHAPAPQVPFPGLVVQLFEKPVAVRTKTRPGAGAAEAPRAVH